MRYDRTAVFVWCLMFLIMAVFWTSVVFAVINALKH